MRRLALLVSVCICALPSGAWAQAPPDEVATRVSEEIMSPFCDGVTLHDCPSAEADELRREISAWARAGMTEEQIIARLEDRYGSVISGSPSSPLAWLIPLLTVAAGVLLVALLARRWRASDDVGHDRPRPPRTPLSPEDRARVDAQIGAFRGRQ
jgi:cytochrome c-type biogenesis protein CcmH/NrfF